jgi:hypothetical protein
MFDGKRSRAEEQETYTDSVAKGCGPKTARAGAHRWRGFDLFDPHVFVVCAFVEKQHEQTDVDFWFLGCCSLQGLKARASTCESGLIVLIHHSTRHHESFAFFFWVVPQLLSLGVLENEV